MNIYKIFETLFSSLIKFSSVFDNSAAGAVSQCPVDEWMTKTKSMTMTATISCHRSYYDYSS